MGEGGAMLASDWPCSFLHSKLPGGVRCSRVVNVELMGLRASKVLARAVCLAIRAIAFNFSAAHCCAGILLRMYVMLQQCTPRRQEMAGKILSFGQCALCGVMHDYIFY